MSHRKPILSFIASVVAAISVFAEGEKKEEIEYEGKKWTRANLAKLYQDPSFYVHDMIYFEIGSVGTGDRSGYCSNHWSLGRQFLPFYTYNDDRNVISLWVKNNRKDALKKLHEFQDGKDRARIFAEVMRKPVPTECGDHMKLNYWHFVIVRHVGTIK